MMVKRTILTLTLLGIFLIPQESAGVTIVEDPFEPDTIIIGSDYAPPTGSKSILVSFINDEALAGIEVTLTWDSPEVVLDSFSFVGGRVDYVSIKGATIDLNTVIIYAFPFGEDDIPTGAGQLGRLFFSYPTDLTALTVTIDSLTIIDEFIVHSNFFSDSDANQFVPQFRSGSLIFPDPGCCIGDRGNFDNSPSEFVDITDLTSLIGYMFEGGPPAACLYEGNMNGDASEMIDISDITYLVSYMFAGGPHPPPCPSQY